MYFTKKKLFKKKLRHILGCLAFSDFFAIKVTLPRSNHILKIEWGINFFQQHF